MRVVQQRAFGALVGEGQGEREGGVAERVGGGARHAAGHVGDAVMHHAAGHISRLGMRGRARGFKAAALVNGDIHGDRAGLHRLHHFFADQFRRLGARNQHAADDQVGLQHMLFNRFFGGEHGVGAAPELRPVALQRGQVVIYDPHIGAHADRDVRGVRADHAGAENHDFRRIHPGHAAEQHAESAVRMLKAIRAGLNGHAPGDLGHRREQRQSAERRSHRLVGDASRAAFNQVARLFRVGREVQVGVEQLPFAQHRALVRLRLLDLDDHFGFFKNFRGRAGDGRAGGRVFVVARADAGAGAGLHQHAVAVPHHLAHARRRHADAVFVVLDFFGDAY